MTVAMSVALQTGGARASRAWLTEEEWPAETSKQVESSMESECIVSAIVKRRFRSVESLVMRKPD